MELRHAIIDKALVVESLLTDCLVSLFRFKSGIGTKTLGMEGNSLPAITKAHVLDDFGYLSKENKEFPKIQKLFEIRNKFAHIASIKTLEDLDENDPKIFTFLKRVYQKPENKPNHESSVEEILKYYVDSLFSDVTVYVVKLARSLTAGFFEEYNNQITARAVNTKLPEIAKYVENQILDWLKEGREITFMLPALRWTMGAAIKQQCIEINHEIKSLEEFLGVFKRVGDWSAFEELNQQFNLEYMPSTNPTKSESPPLESPSDLPSDTLPPPQPETRI